MPRHLAALTLLVRNYDEAIAYYTGVLGFRLVEDTPRPLDRPGKRWVVVAPSEHPQAVHLLLAEPADEAQRAALGNQTGGRVFLFLHTENFERDYVRMQSHGVQFTGPPRDESYGRVVVFLDLSGNKWDLIQPA